MPLTRQEIVEKAFREMDRISWDRLHAEYAGKIAAQGDERSPDPLVRMEKTYSKYFELESWLQYHVRHAMTAHLHTTEGPKRVLDIGCGAGIFLFVCRVLGHTGIGLDIGSDMYRRMAAILEVDSRAAPILAYTPLDDDLQDFDLISAIAIKFDRLDYGPQSREPWSLDEWRYFLYDAATRLKPDGALFIKPNFWVHPTGSDKGIFFKDGRVMDFLKEISRSTTPNFEFIIPRSSLA